MGALWGTWLLLVLLLALTHPMAGDHAGTAGTLAVVLHLGLSIATFVVVYPPVIGGLVAVSLTLRTLLVYWDIYFREIYELVNSGTDSEMYFHYAVRVAEDPSLIRADIRGGMFSKTYGLLFTLIGPDRVFAQYTNAILGISLILIVYAILHQIGIPERTIVFSMVFATLLPNTLVLSSIFLRESIIAFLVAGSLYSFIRWFQHGRPSQIVISVLMILAASTYHSGVITIAMGYILVALVYRTQARAYGVGIHSVFYLTIFVVVIALTLRQYPDLFLGKFEGIETEQDLLDTTNARRGESRFLTSLTVTNYGDLLLYSPIRALYFLGAPMPWDFRGVGDVLTFAFDSLFYLAALSIAIRNFPRLNGDKRLIIALILVITVATLVFGAGISNAGTAMRHRFKLLSLFLLLFGAGHRERSQQLDRTVDQALLPSGTLKTPQNRTRPKPFAKG